MQPLNKLKQGALAVCYSAVLSMMSPYAIASEMKVYLHKEHIEKIIGSDEVKAKGHKINFIYLDRLTELEDQVSKRVTDDYQPGIDEIIAKVGLEELMAMDDVERTELFMKRFTQMKMKPITPKSVLPSELSDIRHAVADVIDAEEQGITEDQLPAVIFNGKLLQQTFDLKEAL